MKKSRTINAGMEAELGRTMIDLTGTLLASTAIEDIADKLLDTALQLTGSRHGFVGYIEPETGFLVVPTLTRDMLADCRMSNAEIVFTEFKGLFGEVLTMRRPVLTNDRQSHPAASGLPDGHIAIDNYLGVPVVSGQELMGQISVANAEKKYTAADQALLERLAVIFALAIERKQTSERVAAESAFNSCVLASLSAHIAIVDKNGVIIQANDPWYRFARENGIRNPARISRGADYLAVCEKSAQSGDDSAQDAANGIRKVLSGRLKHFQMENACHSESAQRWFLMHVTPLDRSMGGAVISHTDITDRKIAETRLAASELQYRTLFNSLHDAIFIHDPGGNMLEVNQEACQRLEYSRQELLSMTPGCIDSAKHAQEVDHRINELLGSGKLFFESEHVSRSGRHIPVEVNSRIIDYGGAPAVLSIARDISRRKQAENRLQKANEDLEKRVLERTDQLTTTNKELKRENTQRRQAERRMRVEHAKMQTVLAAMGAGLVIVNQQFVVEYQNDIHKKWFGDLRGQCFSAFSPMNSYPETRACCLDTKDNPDSSICEMEFVRGGIVFEQNFSLFMDMNQEEKLIVLQRNVSGKKRLEAEAMRAGRLASVGELAAGVAHEINNPINGVINYAQILADDMDPDHELGEIPQRIIRESERVASIVGNLLSFARETADEPAHCRVSDILDDSLELIGRQLSKDGIRLDLRQQDGVSRVLVDARKIQQVFVNLLSNARYAVNSRYANSRADKVVAVRIQELKEEGRRFVRIQFTDNGIGIEKHAINRILDPFFTTKPRGEGTGLGLSITYGIIREHGGRLHIDSEPGVYTRVQVDLPAAEE
ncbi:MAG: PAS domain S-box protein [Desulfobacterales bacterium]